MAIFGYVCSAFCKNEAEQRGLEIPVYENQFGAVAARSTRKLAHIILSVSATLVVVLGGYSWFLFSGSKPRVVFSAKFSTPAYNGGGRLLGTEAVLLHGGHLARFDLKNKKEIWGVDLIDTKEIDAEVQTAIAKQDEAIEFWKKNRGIGDMAQTAPRRRSFIKWPSPVRNGNTHSMSTSKMSALRTRENWCSMIGPPANRHVKSRSTAMSNAPSPRRIHF